MIPVNAFSHQYWASESFILSHIEIYLSLNSLKNKSVTLLPKTVKLKEYLRRQVLGQMLNTWS